ncbi:MAG: helix-turn-helix transcriptional regulator [Saprospiraceae bacterium]
MENKNEITRLSRLTAILILLQSKRILTATEIAKKFDISKRTAYRDVKALEGAGVPIYAEEGKGYTLMEGYNLPPIMFTEEEANALITAGEFISRNKDASLIKNHNNAVTKIKSVLRYSNTDKANLLSKRVFFMKNLKNETTSNFLSDLQLTITHFNLIKIKYHAINKNDITDRRLEPLALYNTSENWILIAWCHTRDDYREFRLDRILKLEILDETFKSRQFDMFQYFTNPDYRKK